jgi:hypothetical protein
MSVGAEANEQGWLGEIAAIETTMVAAAQKLEAMRSLAVHRTTIQLGMPDSPYCGAVQPEHLTHPTNRARRKETGRWREPSSSGEQGWFVACRRFQLQECSRCPRPILDECSELGRRRGQRREMVAVVGKFALP